MIKIAKTNDKLWTVIGLFEGDKFPNNLNETVNKTTAYGEEKKIYIFLGKKSSFQLLKLKTAINIILGETTKGFNIDTKSFITKEVTSQAVIKLFTEIELIVNGNIYHEKTSKEKAEKTFILLNITTSKDKAVFKEAKMFAEIMIWVRSKQIMPPNKLNSVNFAKEITDYFLKNENIKVTILNKKQIEAKKMGLFLSVNRGSSHDARLVVLEYKGAPKSKEISALVGKGIMYDAGGYSIKTGRNMNGMKYDMSGGAIVVGAMKAISELKPKANFIAITPLTDNRLNGDASMPDMVFKSMNGKTVEVNNTDAEGRLVLADAITYAIREKKATNITTIATLTGAVLVALGNTYTGAWATEEKYWERINNSAKIENELIWRMPFHSDFVKYMKGSKVADLKNTDFTGKGGSNSAAMFLKEFSEGKPFVHLDIAGTADVNEMPMSPLVKTLAKLEIN